MFLLYGAITIFTFAAQDYFFIVGWDHSLNKTSVEYGQFFRLRFKENFWSPKESNYKTFFTHQYLTERGKF